MIKIFSWLSALAILPSAVLATLVPLDGEFQVNSFTDDDQDTPSIAVAADGTTLIVWESFAQDGSANGVFVRRFDAAGQPLGDEQQVNTETDDEQEDPAVAVATDGSFIVVWDSALQDGSARGVYGQRYDSAGLPLGGEFQISSQTLGDQNDAVVAFAADGSFMIAWELEGPGTLNEDLFGRRFDAAGDPLGGDFQINTFDLGDQEDLAIASDAAGNFVVVWESDGQDGDLDGIFARRFDAAGAALGDEFQINTFTTGDQDDPDLAVAADGSFVVVWEDNTQDATGEAVYGRTFAADGTALSAAFQIDAFSSGAQNNPRVVLDASGRAVVVWESFGQDGADAAVILNRFDASGQPQDAEIVVNSTVLGSQTHPAIGRGRPGKILVVWESSGGQDGFGLGLFGQRFDDEVFIDGFESGDLDGWSATVP